MQGELAALTTACCWTITALSFESAGRRIGSLSVNQLRLLIALVFLTIYCWISRGLPLPTDAGADTWLWLALSGLVGFTVGDLCLFQAFVLIGSRLSLLLMATVPLFTTLIGLAVLDERLGANGLAGMLLTVAGVVTVVSESRRSKVPSRYGPISGWGITLGLIAALGQAGGLILAKRGMQFQGYDPFAATQIRIIAGAVGFGVLFLFIGWWPRAMAACRDRQAMARVTLGAFFGPFLGVSFSLVAAQKIHAGLASTLMSITPILIIPAVVIRYRERIGVRAVVGTVLAVAGVTVIFLRPIPALWPGC